MLARTLTRLNSSAPSGVAPAFLNKVQLIGYVGQDPKVRPLGGGESSGEERTLTTFSIATTESYKRAGEWVDQTTWHSVVVYNTYLQDVARRGVARGAQVFVEGRVRGAGEENRGQSLTPPRTAAPA